MVKLEEQKVADLSQYQNVVVDSEVRAGKPLKIILTSPEWRLGQKSLGKNSPNKKKGTKASALLCPVCCVEFVEVEFDFEVDGVVLRNVKALRCPACKEERFTLEQYEAIKKRISNST